MLVMMWMIRNLSTVERTATWNKDSRKQNGSLLFLCVWSKVSLYTRLMMVSISWGDFELLMLLLLLPYLLQGLPIHAIRSHLHNFRIKLAFSYTLHSTKNFQHSTSWVPKQYTFPCQACSSLGNLVPYSEGRAQQLIVQCKMGQF